MSIALVAPVGRKPLAEKPRPCKPANNMASTKMLAIVSDDKTL